jgi:NAD(P)-dependent dehydrogenase (short-subunit alcohol dehydrogenase family)
MKGQVALVTGGSSRIGIPTIKSLASTGVTVFATVRNMRKGQKELGEVLKPGEVELIHMFNTSMDSVQAGATEFLDKSGGKLNILICKAGVMAVPKLEHTHDGFEMQFRDAVRYQSCRTFLALRSREGCDDQVFHSRVVTLSSSGHRRSGIRPNSDYGFTEEGSYDPWTGYG